MNRELRPLRPLRALPALLAAAWLGACSSSGSVDIGHGQSAGSGATTDFGIAYIKRTLPTDPVELDKLRALDDLRHLRPYWAKADVYIRDKASPSGVERNITARITGTATGTDFYDVRDLDVSADGTRLVFAMRGPITANQKDFEKPTWRVWEYVIATDDLHTLTDDVTADEGEDVSPHYLPSDSTHPYGRVLITSTRQRYSKQVLLLERKSGFESQTEDGDESAFNLTVLDPTLTGPSAFQQVSFNQSHDLNPSVMAGGRILFTRWDHAPGGPDAMHLYTVNPDGSDLELLFGARSHLIGTPDPATGKPTAVEFVKARQMEDGRILALIRPRDPGTEFGGNLVMIDAVDSVECLQRTVAAGALAAGTNPCPAVGTATANDVRTIPGPSPGGRFNSAFPLQDHSNRVLVSWSDCRLLDATNTIVPCTTDNLNAKLALAPPLYSAWLFDPASNTLKPVVTPVEGVMLTDVVSLQAHPAPLFVQPVSTATTLAGDGAGIIDIRSVYDFGDDTTWPGYGGQSPATFIAAMATTPADLRPARFLRIEKAVSMGDDNLMDGFPDFDRNIALGNSVGYMREILGYVPIEADGSVRVKLPANVAFQITVLDAKARRIPLFPQHRNWLQLRPGEVLSCNGCHNATSATSTTSHGRAGLFDSANNPGGKTLAQQLYGNVTDCGAASCNAATPSVNVVYAGTGAAGDTAIDYSYNAAAPVGLAGTPYPTDTSCLNLWSATCRITINYAASDPKAANTTPAYIEPLWTVDRGVHTCTGCHTETRTQTVSCTPAGTSTPINVTYGVGADGGLQLDLPPVAATQSGNYLQLVSTHDASTFSLDANCGQVRTATQVPGSLAPGSAAASHFFAVLEGRSNTTTNGTAGNVNHAGFMTPAELRLLSEWVDVGAQYYNNPFAATLN